MTNKELIKIRENRNLTKSDFAKLLGVTPMLLGRYESGNLPVPVAVAEKALAIAVEEEATKAARTVAKGTLAAAALIGAAGAVKDKAVATEIEVKRTTRDAGRKAKEKVEDTIAEAAFDAKKAVKDKKVATEIEVKKTARGTARKAAEKIEDTVAETAFDAKEKAVAAEIEVKKQTRAAGRKVKEVAKEAAKGAVAGAKQVKETAEAIAQSDEFVATEIEVKKAARKAGRKAKEAAATAKEIVEEKAVATEIEVKKNARQAGRKAKEAAQKAVKEAKLSIQIQSPMGGVITPEEIAKKIPKNAKEVYVRVDENKLYYVLKNGESGDVDIWY